MRTVLIFNARTKIWSPKNVQTGQKGPRACAGYQCGSGQPHEPAARARRDILPSSKHAAQRAPKAIFLSHHSTTKLQRKRMARWTTPAECPEKGVQSVSPSLRSEEYLDAEGVEGLKTSVYEKGKSLVGPPKYVFWLFLHAPLRNIPLAPRTLGHPNLSRRPQLSVQPISTQALQSDNVIHDIVGIISLRQLISHRGVTPVGGISYLNRAGFTRSKWCACRWL